jgi:hypothetical protein
MRSEIKILVGCERSGIVRSAFEKRGFDVWSCDLKATDKPGKHFQTDIFNALNFRSWDLFICFPPCTHLAVSGAKHFDKKISDGRQQQAIDFFLSMARANVHRVCIENPVGIMSTKYRKPTQIIHPFMFGDPFQKTTCLWLKNLPRLFHAAAPDLFNDTITHVHRGEMRVWKSGKKMASWFNETKKADKELTSQLRSITFPGIAEAMAEQWSQILINNKI